jgi:hypothetical protein
MSRLLCATLALALTAAACGGSDPIIPPPTGPTIPVTDTFPPTPPGTLTPNGAVTHSFQAAAAGTIQASITALSDTAAVVGFALGTFNGTGCQLIIANDTARQGTLITGSTTSSGALCVRIYDATGTLTGPIEYTLSVTHP